MLHWQFVDLSIIRFLLTAVQLTALLPFINAQALVLYLEESTMATINQLVRKPRQASTYKSASRHLISVLSAVECVLVYTLAPLKT